MKWINKMSDAVMLRAAEGVADVATDRKTKTVSDYAYASFVAVAIALCTMYMPQLASASGGGGAGGNIFASTLCNALALLNQVGGPIAMVAVIVIGLGALLGKVTWGMAVLIVVGIATIFGASELVQIVSGKSACS